MIVTVIVTVIRSDSDGDSYSLMLRCGSMTNLALSYSYGVVGCTFSYFRDIRVGGYRVCV